MPKRVDAIDLKILCALRIKRVTAMYRPTPEENVLLER